MSTHSHAILCPTTPSYDRRRFNSNLLHALQYMATLFSDFLRITTPFWAFDRLYSIPIFAYKSFTSPSYDLNRFTCNLLHDFPYIATFFSAFVRIPTPSSAFERFFSNLVHIYPFLRYPMPYYAFLLLQTI